MTDSKPAMLVAMVDASKKSESIVAIDDVTTAAAIQPIEARAHQSTEAVQPEQLETAQVAPETTADPRVKSPRCCWICFATDEDNKSTAAAWVQPCQCRGTRKWVHQRCLYRLIAEQLKGKTLRSITCTQCQTKYLIVFKQMSKLSLALEAVNNLYKRVSTFLAGVICVGSIYWTAVTYGAVTVLQIMGHQKGMSIMKCRHPLTLFIGLPAIPVGLVLGRWICWEEVIIRLTSSFESILLYEQYEEEDDNDDDDDDNDDETISLNSATPSLLGPMSAQRVICGALLLPTISASVGFLLFNFVENTLHRAILGGLTYTTVKGLTKIYLEQKQQANRKKRRILDYTEENIRTFVEKNGNEDAEAVSIEPQEPPGSANDFQDCNSESE